jgi:hypothetical protein
MLTKNKLTEFEMLYDHLSCYSLKNLKFKIYIPKYRLIPPKPTSKHTLGVNEKQN